MCSIFLHFIHWAEMLRVMHGIKIYITMSAGSLAKYLSKYDIPSPLATAWPFVYMSTKW